MSLRAVAYVSEAVDGLDGEALDRILRESASYNGLAGVTGVLMFDGIRFLHYFEGPEDGVRSVYPRVLNAKSHRHLRELAKGDVAIRHFPRWAMASARIDAAVLADIADTAWDGFNIQPALTDHGFARLLALWTGASGEREPAAISLGS